MDKYEIKVLRIVSDYEGSHGRGIGISVLDRKFYREFSYDEVYLAKVVQSLKNSGHLKQEKPYSLTTKGKQVLSNYDK